VSSHQSASLASRIVREGLVLVALVVGVTTAKEAGSLRPLENLFLDVFAPAEGERRSATHTVLFDINDTNLKTFRPQGLIDTGSLAKLVHAGFASGAQAVVVDVETDHEAVLAALPPDARVERSRIVWARDAVPCGVRAPCEPACDSCVQPLATLTAQHGIALLTADHDQVIRRYDRIFKVPGPCLFDDCQHPSLPTAALMALKRDVGGHGGKPRVLNWLGDRWAIPRVSAEQALAGMSIPGWSNRFPDRVALIGGTFHEGRDVHQTPAGPMAGVEVMAHIIETELSGGGLKQLGIVGGVVLEVIAGIALIALNWRFPAGTRWSLAVNAAAVLALPIVASYLMYSYALFWVNVAPVLVGVWIHQWHTRAHALSAASRAVGGV
jgi:CHASE2 domain-containing sensor protein